jgi:CMP-N-acetylneuraminic acid synthetase
MEFVRHATGYFMDEESTCPDYLVHLRPTTPLRDPVLIDEAVRLIEDSEQATGLRSVHEIPESPYKMFVIKDGYLEGLFPDDSRPEYYNLPRQSFPPVYKPNGYVDVIKPETVLKLNSLHGSRMLSFITPDTGELDTEEDFNFIEYKLNKSRFEIYEYLRKNYEAQ